MEDLTATVPDGGVQPPPLPRATRKRLTALRNDLATRIAAQPQGAGESTPAPLAPAAAAGRSALHLLREHARTGDPATLVEARRLVGDALAARGHDGELANLAWLGRSLLALHGATLQDPHLAAAQRLAAAVRRLEVPRGGFRNNPGAAKDALDAAANGAAASFLVELAWRIGVRGGHRDAAEKALRRVAASVADRADGAAQLLDAIDGLLAEPVHATVVGALEHPGVRRLHGLCLQMPADPLVVDWRRAGHDFPDVGAPAVYLCRGTRCASPVTDEADLLPALARLA